MNAYITGDNTQPLASGNLNIAKKQIGFLISLLDKS